MSAVSHMAAGSDRIVYVEDNADTIWRVWFPRGSGVQFEDAGGKGKVWKQVRAEAGSFGVVDRDFDDDEAVRASRGADSRVWVLDRYCVESYLLEPVAIAQVAELFPPVARSEPDWTNAVHIESTLLEWGRNLRFYAAANHLIDDWNRHIQLLRYFRPSHSDRLFDREFILGELYAWARGLPVEADVERELDERAAVIGNARRTIAGAHRWIDGKAILGSLLHPDAFHAIRLSSDDLKRYLAEAAKTNLPADLQTLAQRWQN